MLTRRVVLCLPALLLGACAAPGPMPEPAPWVKRDAASPAAGQAVVRAVLWEVRAEGTGEVLVEELGADVIRRLAQADTTFFSAPDLHLLHDQQGAVSVGEWIPGETATATPVHAGFELDVTVHAQGTTSVSFRETRYATQTPRPADVYTAAATTLGRRDDARPFVVQVPGEVRVIDEEGSEPRRESRVFVLVVDVKRG